MARSDAAGLGALPFVLVACACGGSVLVAGALAGRQAVARARLALPPEACALAHNASVGNAHAVLARARAAAGDARVRADEPAGAVLPAWWGVVLALASGVVNAGSLALQKAAHDRLRSAEAYAYLGDGRWWTGFAGITASELLNGVAYGFAPAPVVSALAGTTVVLNAWLARRCRAERLSRVGLVGVASVVVGGVLVALGTPQFSYAFGAAELEALAWRGRAAAPAYLIGSAAAVAAAAYAAARRLGGRRGRFWWLASQAAIVASWTVLGVRGVVGMLSRSARDCRLCACTDTLGTPTFWLLAGAIVASAAWGGGVVEQRGLAEFAQTTWVTVHYCACALWITLASAAVYDDVGALDGAAGAVVLLGAAACVAGAALLWMHEERDAAARA